MLRKLLSSLSSKEIQRPVFIIGCGRSGTTIFGTALSHHHQITYLNERRDLWHKAYPIADIWSEQGKSHGAKMQLTSADADVEKSALLRTLFYRQTIRTSRPILVEKLPINNFRLEFIHSIFPDARFIHIFRNGLEVARSIQKMSEAGKWFAANEYKWQQLCDYSKSNTATEKLPELCDSYYHKGLLEWRLSTEAVVSFLSQLDNDKYMEISYSALASEAENTIEKVLDYLQIDHDPGVTDFVKNKISRRTANLENSEFTETESQLGGQLLSLSIDNTTGGLSHVFSTGS